MMTDEYIKRTNALKALEWTWAGKAAFDNLKAIPAEDVVPVVRGKWINDHNGKYSPLGDNFFCSVCKEPSLRAYGRPAKTNFCPNCGANLKDGAENE